MGKRKISNIKIALKDIRDIILLKKFRNNIMNYIETYFIVKTMYCILESVFFDSFISYHFSIENKNNEFIILITTEEELDNGKIIKNKKIKLESFAFLILNVENFKTRIIKDLKERN